nr:hypothetical protein [Tanacetum cinerariifolium]
LLGIVRVATKQSGEDAPINGRSSNEGEAAAERISNDSKEIATVLTSMDVATVLAGETNVEDFIPMGPKEESKRLKRKGLNLEKEQVHSEGERSYWQIIRLGGSSACYQFFVDLLRQLDRENLNQLWALVKEYLSIRPASKWKIYDLSGVHHVTAKDKEIFMLVEKDYPLKRGLALVMISYRLQVKNHSHMAEYLIRKIYNIANTLRK